jgi:hypothetical protein
MKTLVLTRDNLNSNKRHLEFSKITFYDFLKPECSMDVMNKTDNIILVDEWNVKILKNKHSNLIQLFSSAPEMLEDLKEISNAIGRAESGANLQGMTMRAIKKAKK